MKTKQLVSKKKGKLSSSGLFFSDFKSELRKVEWPERSLVIKSSVLVLVFMVLFASFVAVVDGFFSKALISLKGI